LLKEALANARRLTGAIPRAIRAVRTTLAKAGHAKQKPELAGQTHVYLVAMRIGTKCNAPHGETCAQKHVLELEFLASNLETLREETRVSYPNLKKVGVPVLLAAKAK
jgi:hypothetical protein